MNNIDIKNTQNGIFGNQKYGMITTNSGKNIISKDSSNVYSSTVLSIFDKYEDRFDDTEYGSVPPRIQLYVATDGDDNNDGSLISPFLTIGKAKSTMSGLIEQGLTSDATVYLRGGTHRLTSTETFVPTDGDSTYKVIYRGYPGETAIINGGKIVSGTWTNEGGGIYSLPLPGQSMFQMLYINGVMATRARWPNEKDYHLLTVFPGVTTPIVHDHILWDQNAGLPDGLSGRPLITAGEITAGHPELIVFGDFNIQRYKYLSADATKVNISTDSSGHGINFFSHYNRYYWENSKAFITEQGEWYFDDQAGTQTLYYMPTTQQITDGLSGMLVEVPQINTIFKLVGDDPVLPALASDFTVSMWFKTSYSASGVDWQKTLFQNWALAGNFNGFYMDLRQEVDGGGALQREGFIYIAYGLDKSYSDWTIGINDLNDGAWHHVVVSVLAPTAIVDGSLRMWIDGIEETNWHVTNDQTIVAGSAKSDYGPMIGSLSNGRIWDGELDDVVVLDIDVSSDAQITSLSNKTYSGLTGNMVFHLPLNGTYDLTCDTITGVESWYGYNISDGVNYDTSTIFVDGGVGHNPCVQFDGTVYQRISVNNRPGKRINNLTFRSLEMTCTDRPDVGTDGWTAKNSDEYDFPAPGVIDLRYCNNIVIRNCNIHDIAGTAVYSMMSENCDISYNTISDIGMYGIVMDCISRNIKSEKNWEGHTVNYNTIHDIGIVHKSSTGILFVYTTRSQINYNYLYNIPRNAISSNCFYSGYDGNWADLEVGYNKCRNCLTHVQHNGVLRMNGYVPGGRYHHNHIKDTLRTTEHTFRRLDELENYPIGYAIHFDQGAGGTTIDYNLIVNTSGGAGMRWNSVFDTIVNNNVFIGSRLGASSFTQNLYKIKSLTDGVWGQATNNTITNNIYYSLEGDTGWLPDYVESDKAAYLAAFQGKVDKNCYWSNGNDPLGYWTSSGLIFGTQTPKPLSWAFTELEREENSIEQDPQFVDYDNGDYTVTNQSVLNLGFKNFTVPSF